MKVELDELTVIAGLDGPATMPEHENAVEIEEAATVGAVEALLRVLQAERWEDELKLYRLLN